MKVEKIGAPIASWEDGDFSVKFYLEDYLIETGVCANSHEQALRFAEEKLGSRLPTEEIEEVVITLCGIYA